MMNSSSWIPTYTIPYVGTCFKLRASQICLKSGEIMYIRFKMADIKYSIYLFDPKSFILKKDNSIVPFLLLDDPISKIISLHSTFTSKMNRPKFPCNPDKTYIYNQCVKTSLAKRIGCTNPFDGSGQIQNVPNCTTTTELFGHWTANVEMYKMDQENLFELTKCELPCHYQHYSVVGTPHRFEVKNYTYIQLFYTSTDTRTNQEVLLYPFDSLVSEFGGALGLFLGFSFLRLLDIIQNSWTSLVARLNIYQVTKALPDI